MRDAERRLLRCIGWIDNELILEAEQTRFRPRRWGSLLALAACVAVVLSIPFLLPQEEKLALDVEIEQTQGANKGAAGTESALQEDAWEESAGYVYNDAPILFSETISDLKIAMTEQEILDLLGEPVTTGNVEMETPDGAVHKSWFYKTGTNPDVRTDTQLSLANVGDGWFLNEIYLHSNSGLTLSTGIGIGSWIDEVQTAYPDASCTEWTAIENDKEVRGRMLSLGDPAGLSIQVENGVTWIRLGPWLQIPDEELWNADPELPYNLTSGELIHYEWRDKAWVQTRIIDKAAKHICITMTISEPEEAFKEKDGVSRWIDFCNGTAVELRGDDIASVYTYTGETFDPDKLDGLTWHLEGRYTGLDNAVEQSLANPTETWEVESKPEDAPEEESEAPAGKP